MIADIQSWVFNFSMSNEYELRDTIDSLFRPDYTNIGYLVDLEAEITQLRLCMSTPVESPEAAMNMFLDNLTLINEGVLVQTAGSGHFYLEEDRHNRFYDIGTTQISGITAGFATTQWYNYDALLDNAKQFETTLCLILQDVMMYKSGDEPRLVDGSVYIPLNNSKLGLDAVVSFKDEVA